MERIDSQTQQVDDIDTSRPKDATLFELVLRLIDSKHDLCLSHEFAYEPQYSISLLLLNLVELVAALRDRIQSAAVELCWIPALQKDTRTRSVHASTAIEGNPLTLEQVRALEEGRELQASDERSQQEVLNHFAGLRFVEKHARKKIIRHNDLF